MRYFVLVLWCLGLFGCARPLPLPQLIPNPTKTVLARVHKTASSVVVSKDETYAVYSALIEQTVLSTKKRSPIEVRKPVKQIVLRRMTTAGTDYLKYDVPGLRQETKRNFLKRNRKQISLEAQFHLSVPVVLLEKDQIVFVDEKFYQQYKGAQGVMELSPIGFNGEHTQALVYVVNIPAFSAGSGYFVLLNKVDGVWKVSNVRGLWIA